MARTGRASPTQIVRRGDHKREHCDYGADLIAGHQAVHYGKERIDQDQV